MLFIPSNRNTLDQQQSNSWRPLRDALQLPEWMKISRKFVQLCLKTDDETIEAIIELSGITWSSVQRILCGDFYPKSLLVASLGVTVCDHETTSI
ncbi:hypothetical protein CEXT_754851 [Caerostris extrusa]|uniref:Transcriptional regulator n=1 Tax=Caerostris extrusa TaxID=172846 RepID=A0AAV4SN35_CAEEX|nr:hypothetical protein CEXT_754851 [Caerostris extrusa]